MYFLLFVYTNFSSLIENIEVLYTNLGFFPKKLIFFVSSSKKMKNCLFAIPFLYTFALKIQLDITIRLIEKF